MTPKKVNPLDGAKTESLSFVLAIKHLLICYQLQGSHRMVYTSNYDQLSADCFS